MNIAKVEDCFGCGVCAVVCSRNAINIKLNIKGFYQPYLDETRCSGCGLCADVCSFLHKETALSLQPICSYGMWSNDPKIRHICSSGGVGYELGKYLIGQGYNVCCVRYNSDMHRAEHYIATNIQELIPSIGSKYIQSYTFDGFSSINRKDKYLVTGTPCQIDSFRRYIRRYRVEDNFVLMDFFCHSVPSMLAWRKYLQFVENITGPVCSVSWRNKFTGWHDSWAMELCGQYENRNEKCFKAGKGGRTYRSRLSQGDIFYKLFLGDYCCNPACQNDCKYKYDKSSADIRIGDFWGDTYIKDEEGVSAAVAYTEKGKRILHSLDCTIEEHIFEVVAEGQMKKNAGQAYTSKLVFKALNNESSTEHTFRNIFRLEAILSLPKKVYNKIKRIIWEKS